MRQTEVRLWLIEEWTSKFISVPMTTRLMSHVMEIGLVYDPTGDWLSLFLDELEPLLENLREGLQKLLYKQVFPQPTEEEMQQRIDYKVRQEQIRYWGRQVMKEHGW